MTPAETPFRPLADRLRLDLAHLPELVLEMEVIGIEPHGLGQFRGGIVDASLTEEHHTEARVPVGAVGLQPERVAIRGLRLVQASLL